MEEKINEITQLVKKEKFKKNRKAVLRLLNELSAMTKECEPGGQERERVRLTSLLEESF